MSKKRKSTTPQGSLAKKQRKAIDIDTKLKIIKQHEGRMKVQAIASSMGLAYSTISTIIKDKARVKETAVNTIGCNALLTRQRKGVIHEMEKLLALWVDDKISKKIPVSLILIQTKALSIFNTLKSH
ncbi:putative CENPB DNA-binding domain-containing protein 1 [Palaemon carinicauda]|uniref:putative CENPB DNA-binding domain-containing protein 1 n=1 Tax=Palaemon carinicauda TaxID=392227 RepID=UPI0035B608B2